MEKGVFVKDIKPGLRVSGVFIALNPALAQSGRGPFWKFSLADATGSVPAKIWYPKSAEYADIPAGAAVEARGGASAFNGQTQVSVEYLAILDGATGIDQGWFLPMSSVPPEEMLQELRQLCLEEFTHRPWRKFVLAMLDDTEITEALLLAPAAKSVHQAYLGGLLEHSLGVARVCLSIAGNYPELDRQTLLAAAIFHDIGKIREYSWDFKIDSTDDGELLGHLFLGLEIMEPKLAASGLEPELAAHFRHLVLSHHGQHEYGSPKLPQTAEAFVLHFADNIDAKLAQCREAEAPEGSAWTERQWALGRRLFKPKKTPIREKGGARASQDPACLSLLRE